MTDTTASNLSHDALVKNWPKLDDDRYLDVTKGSDHAEWRMAKNGLWYFYRSHHLTWGVGTSYKPVSSDLRWPISYRGLDLYPKLRASTMILRANGNIQIMLIGQRPVAKQSTGEVVFPCKPFFYVLKPMIHKIKASRHRRICYQVFSERAGKLQLLTLSYHPADWGTSVSAVPLFSNRKLGYEPLVASAFPDDWFRRNPIWTIKTTSVISGTQLCFDGLGRERNF